MESISRLEDHQNRLAEKQSDYASGLKRVQDLLDIRLVWGSLLCIRDAWVIDSEAGVEKLKIQKLKTH